MESRDSMPKQQYDESSIVILEGLDAVRKRPGMYIGSTDSKGLHHLVWEIVDNAIDEALNGYGNEIAITLEKDGSVTVEDHGRGMPVGKHKSGVSTLQVIFTILHAGGKFTSHGGYTSAGGLHGVGASVVNALCTWCKVTVHDGKDIWSMTFEDGGSKIGKLEKVGKTNRTGSTVTFKPDPTIFKTVHFSYSTICERAQEDAFLLKGLKMIVRDKRKEEKEVIYQYEDGLKAFIDEVNQDHTPMHDSISFRGESNQIVVEGCFQYTDEYQENIFSFTNMVRTRDGGSHETGAKQAFTKVFNEYARKNGFLKEKDKGFDGNDVREGLTLVINLTIPEDYLQFEGQTKEKLGSPEAKPATETVVSENLRYFLEENKEIANALVRKIIKAAQARNAAGLGGVRLRRQQTALLQSSAPAQPAPAGVSALPHAPVPASLHRLSGFHSRYTGNALLMPDMRGASALNVPAYQSEQRPCRFHPVSSVLPALPPSNRPDRLHARPPDPCLPGAPPPMRCRDGKGLRR